MENEQPFEVFSNSSPKKRRGLRGCVVILAVLFIAPFLFFLFVFPSVHYIGWLPSGESYKATRIEFRFGHATRVVEDPENHMQWIYGEMPDSIAVTDGIRLIVYNEPKAIMKSWGDSMDAQQNSLKHKGWMGIWSNGDHFVIDSNGVVHER